MGGETLELAQSYYPGVTFTSAGKQVKGIDNSCMSSDAQKCSLVIVKLDFGSTRVADGAFVKRFNGVVTK